MTPPIWGSPSGATETRRTARDPAVRAALDRGRRAPPRAAATSAARARSRCSRSCSRRAAIGSRSTASPSCCGATSGRGTSAGSLQTFVSVLRRHLSRRPGAGPRARRHRAGGVPLRDRARRRSTSTASTSSSSARPASRRACARASLEQALALVRGEVLEDEPYAAWALDLRGSYQGRVLGARLDAADAALAELDFAPALAHARGGRDARPLQRARPPPRDARPLRARPAARGARPLPRASGGGSTRSSDSSRPPRRARSRRPSSARRTSDSLLPRPIRARSRGRPARRALRLLGRTAELETLTERRPRGARRRRRARPDRGRGRARQDAAARRAGSASSTDVRVGRASCSELERHLPYVPLAAALREALAGVELDGRVPAGARRRSCPSSTLGAPRREFDEVEVLEALVALVAEHAPLVLLLDDLHWADAQTLAALGYLRRRGARPRRGARDDRATRGGSAGDHPLRRSDPTSSCGSSRSRRAELAPLGMPELHESTGGNPRFVGEALANGQPAGPLADARRGAARPVPRRGRLGLPRPRRRLRARAAVRARAARRPPRRRRSRTHRGARAPLRAANPARRRAPLPLPLRPRPPGAAREASHPPGDACCSGGSTLSARTSLAVSQAG